MKDSIKKCNLLSQVQTNIQNCGNLLYNLFTLKYLFEDRLKANLKFEFKSELI